MTTTELKYSVQKIDVIKWDNILRSFDDASLYQTEAFTKFSVGGNNIEQFTMYQNELILSAALVRVKTIPILNRGVAYIRWAPLWQRSNSPKDISVFEKAIKFLYEEYVIKRKLTLRIMSNLDNDDNNITNIIKQNKYEFLEGKGKSILVDISKDEDEIRSSFRKKWRYSLRQAEKKELEIRVGTDEFLFNEFLDIYKQMHSRKNFTEFVNVESFQEMNKLLSEKNKMRIFICSLNGETLSAMVTSVIGNTGIYLLGGTTLKGLELSSSYLLQWEVIKWMKKHGIENYDLGGIDKEENPGVYTFKSGMGGKEITYVSGFEASKSFVSKSILDIAQKLK